jgi:hypothetical protein
MLGLRAVLGPPDASAVPQSAHPRIPAGTSGRPASSLRSTAVHQTRMDSPVLQTRTSIGSSMYLSFTQTKDGDERTEEAIELA